MFERHEVNIIIDTGDYDKVICKLGLIKAQIMVKCTFVKNILPYFVANKFYLQ